MRRCTPSNVIKTWSTRNAEKNRCVSQTNLLTSTKVTWKEEGILTLLITFTGVQTAFLCAQSLLNLTEGLLKVCHKYGLFRIISRFHISGDRLYYQGRLTIPVLATFSSNSEGIVQKRMRCCTPLKVIKRVKIPSSFHVTFVLVNKFVCDTHLFSTLIVNHVLITLEGVKRVLFYTIPSELDKKVVNCKQYRNSTDCILNVSKMDPEIHLDAQ